MRSSLIILALVAVPAWAQVTVEEPWSRATPPGAKVGVGYMRIKNAGSATARVVGASSPLAKRVELHVTERDGGVLRMQMTDAYVVPAGGEVVLEPGGSHLMLMGLEHPLKEGEHVPLTLKLEQGGEVQVRLSVGAMGARQPTHGHPRR